MTVAKKTTKTLKRGPKGGRDCPVNADRVFKIVEMRDTHGMIFREIAEELSVDYPITGQGVYSIYKKWRDWAVAEKRKVARRKK